MRPNRGPPRKRGRSDATPTPAAIAEGDSSGEDAEKQVENEMETFRDELRDVKITISCLRTSQQDLISRLTGLERHVKDAFEAIHDKLATVIVRDVEPTKACATNATATKLLDLLQESRTGFKKVVRESIRLYMFSPFGGMYAPDNRRALSGLYLYYIDFEYAKYLLSQMYVLMR